MRQIVFYSLLALILSYNKSFAQSGIFVNRIYQQNSGDPVLTTLFSPYGLPYSKSIRTSAGNFITVGHSSGATSEDVYVICRDVDGNLMFEQLYDIVNANKNDYALDISEAPNGDFLICGATQTGGLNGYDAFVLRITSGGTYIVDNVRDGGNGLDDFAVAIQEVSGGNVAVAANRQVPGGMFDYWVIRYDPSFNFQLENFYDYTGLTDIAIGFKIVGGSGEVQLVGGSASGLTSCDYALARFDISTLSFLGDARSSLSGSMMDKALAFARDASDNTYITGTAWNGTNFEIKTVKINANFSIGWTKTFDPYGYENVGSSIQVDANGDVVVAGYVTQSNNTKQTVCIKYNGSTGNTMWASPLMQQAENPAGDAFIKKIALNPSGDIYYVGSEKSVAGNDRVLVGKIKASGVKSWQKNIGDDATINYLPSDIRCEGGNIYVVSVKDSVNDEYIITAYEELELDTALVYATTGTPLCKKRELIVRFNAAVLDSAFIDNTAGSKNTTFGCLQDFMKPAAYWQVMTALDAGRENCEIKAVKVFPGLTTTYTSSVSRLGEVVPIPDLWTTLLLEFPASYQIQNVHAVFNTLPNLISYSHPNFLAGLSPVPSSSQPALPPATLDPWYPFQTSLYTSTQFPNADINVEQAWQIHPEGGLPFVKAGVFDTGCDWKHTDFGYTPANPSGSKVEGWDFQTLQNIRYLPDGGDYMSHGTPVSGIIGAIRNNTIAVKGIAGGNDTLAVPNKGVSLYGLRILNSQPFANTLNYIADAIATSAFNNVPGVDYDYALNLQNHSWGMPENLLPWYTDSNIVTLTEAVHLVNRLNVTFVAARGNTGANTINYPGVTDDDWVLLVSGLASNGNFADSASTSGYFKSNWGRNVDIGAPSDINNIFSICTSTFSGNGITNFGMTSGATPHASGVVALLMSYMNDTLNPYNNLAPEDCEQIIQLSASPMPNGSPLPNDSVGYGKLNAGKALSLVQKPCNKLWHFGTKYFSHILTKTIIGHNDTVIITERCHDLSSPFNYLKKGKYIVNTWQIDATVNHNLPSTDTIKAFWPRPSMSDVWERVKNKKLLPRERDTILSCNNSQAQLRGYIYQVSDTLGTPLGWWPCDTSFSYFRNNSVFEYSILTKTCTLTDVSIKENQSDINSFVNVFPNPGNSSQTIVLETGKVSDATIDLYDLTGRFVKRVYSGKTNAQKTLISNDISNLASSLYIYVIRVDGGVRSYKFIKE